MPADRSRTTHQPAQPFKVVAEARTDRVLGVHVVPENAGDVIDTGVLALRFHLTVNDLMDTFAPYLTVTACFRTRPG